MLRDGAGELDEARLLTKKLGWKIKSIRLHGVPFRDVVPYLRDRFDVNIEVDWAGLAQAGVDLNAPLRINVRNCTFSKLLWSVADGVKTDAVWPGIVIDGDTIRIGKAGRRPGLVRIRMRGKGKFRLNARHLDGAAALRKEIIALELPKRAEAIITVEAEASQAAVADLLRLIMAAEIQNIRLEGNGRVLPTPDRKASRAK